MRRWIYVVCSTILISTAAHAAAPSPSSVLVVYAKNVPESVDVAASYAEKRSIPPSNLCPITLPENANDWFTGDDYQNVLLKPVRACLEAAGKRDILYIVLAYVRPYRLDPGAGLRQYAIDSYLADIWDEYFRSHFNPSPGFSYHPYFAQNQAQGNVFLPFVSLADFRKDSRNPLIYAVWRLDGATPDAAKALVDKAIYAESHGLGGQACIDALLDPAAYADAGLRGADWDLYRAAGFLKQAGWTLQFDTNGEEIGVDPAPATCSDAALYAGWYSINRYNDVFTWVPGAIGFHLDSSSLTDPRGGPSWSAIALQHGLTVTSGAIAEPYIENLPRASGLFRDLMQGATAGEAFLRNTPTLKWRVLNVGDPMYQPFPNGMAPFDKLPSDRFPGNFLLVQARAAVSGDAFRGVVQIEGSAPAGGTAVKLASDNAGVAVPDSITIPEGGSFAVFLIATSPVPSLQPAQVTATAGDLVLRNTVLVFPILGAVAMASESVKGGDTLQAQVLLYRLAPEGGYPISLSVEGADGVKVPASVLVPAGSAQATFTIETAAVKEKTDVKLIASYQGATVTTKFTVVP